MILTVAKNMLEEGGYTCVLTDGNRFFTSTQRGVKPLVQFLESKQIPAGLYAADKVVGRATAHLYGLLSIQALYAKVISEPALTLLKSRGIFVSYDLLVPNIINRAGDGICPFEEAVMGIEDPRAAYTAILDKMAQLQIRLWA